MNPPIERPPRRRRRAFLVVVLVAIAWTWTGCTSTVYPPTAVRSPTDVFLIQEELHVGIVLPDGSGTGYVEYGFGDWSWFGAGETGCWSGTAAVLWPTQGAIGRRLWSAHDEAALRHFASFADFDKLTVERDRVDALRSQLHDEWSRGRTSTPDGGNYDRRFLMVHGEQDYWFLNSCADVCAEWVEVLGCEVSWVPIRVGLAAATE